LPVLIKYASDLGKKIVFVDYLPEEFEVLHGFKMSKIEDRSIKEIQIK